jgi:hypothetical protein
MYDAVRVTAAWRNFPSLAAHPLSIGLRVCRWGTVLAVNLVLRAAGPHLFI